MNKFIADLTANMLARGLTQAQVNKALLALREELKACLPLKMLTNLKNAEGPLSNIEEKLLEFIA